MKRCNTCETSLPDSANVCSQCGTILPGAPEVTIRQDPILLDDRTVADVAIMPEVEEMTIKGLPVLNPVTPIPNMEDMDNLPTLENTNGIPPDISPTIQDHDASITDTITDDPTPVFASDDDPTPTLPVAYDDKTITGAPVPVFLVENASVITDDPTPASSVAQTADAILDDPAPASLIEHDAGVITDDPTPLLELQSDTAIIRADAPIPVTDPHLSAATMNALALLSDQDDATLPVNGHGLEQVEESDSLSVATFLETGEETPVHNGHAIPAPLYPDYGKTNNTPPSPLYEDYKKASTSSTATAPTKPQNVSTTYPHIWSRRGLITIALCLLIILGSIGLFITHKAQNGGAPVTHTIAAKLRAVSPSLTSQVVKGHKVILAAAIANDGGQALHWTADTGQTSWLSIDKNKASGIIPAGAPQQTIYARVDATSLDAGNYSGALQIHSSGGNASISITLNVLPANSKTQPIMTVDPTTLTFGSLQQGQQATKTIYITNTGTATLNWQASVGNVDWITLTPPSGTILAGSYPQPLVVTINTTRLNLGLSPANLNITSNASAAQPPVTISVNVTAASGNALTISANPGSFTNGCLNCTVILSASQGGQGSQPSVQWSTSGVGVPGITFSPSTGTLQAGQSTPVTVTVPNTTCPAGANFNFASAANTFSVVWNCTPPPTPNAILTASPTNLTNCYTCTVNISPASGSQSSLKWSSTGSGVNGITINPPGGTVAAGSSQAVTITVPNTSCPSNANSATLTFSGQGAGNSVPVYWSCTPPSQQTPQISVSPNALNSSQCTSNGNNTYNCTVTLSESPAGNLSWSSYTNVGGTFSPSSGNFTGGTTSMSITINNILCQSGTFGFTGTNTSVSVQWTCNTPVTPTLSVNPTTLNANSCASDGNGGYNCNVTLNESPQGTLAWQESNNLNVSVSPQNGTLTPGNQSASITLFSIPCQPTGTNGTFTFSATGSNSVSVNWGCTAPPTVTTPPTTVVPPVAPSNVSATATSSSSIQVTWSDNSNNETGFTIYNGVTSATVAANTINYTWGSLAPGTYMCFSLSAYNTAGSSAGTPYVCATTPRIPAAPSNVSATATNSSSIQVTWSDNSNNEDGFTVSNGVTSVNVAANTTNYSWGGLTAGSYMCVHILAYNTAGSSAWTPYACATTTPQAIPAMLSFSPGGFPNASGCSYAAGSGWTCVDKLSVNADATQNLTWNVSASNPDIQFSSYGGTMTPGENLPITITIPDRFCPVNAFFLFAATNQGNGIYVNWNCNAVLASYWSCTAITVGSQYQCTITPYMVAGGQGSMSWIAHTASGALFQPTNGGTVTPNGSLTTVSVTTGCYDTFTIVGQGGSMGMGNTVTIPWACK